MNGIWIETQGKRNMWIATKVAKCAGANILVEGGGEKYYAEYRTVAKRDRAWAMLENAIATGVRLFRFPTDAEVEATKEEQ